MAVTRVLRDASTEDQWMQIHRLADAIAEIALTMPQRSPHTATERTNEIMPYILERMQSKTAQPKRGTKRIRDTEGSGYHVEEGYLRIKIPLLVRRICYMRDGWQCVQCGHPGDPKNPLTLDHIKPVDKGGLSIPENLQTLCSKHNQDKGNDYHDEMTAQ